MSTEKSQSHSTGTMYKTIDFIEDLKSEGREKLLIASHRIRKCEKWEISERFHEIPTEWL
jgi:hypothetical protein